jgi:hypothetical protein
LFRTLKIQLNELNELFSNIQSDLRTRSQACEFVQTCIDEINIFLDSLQIQSNDNEILSLTLIKNLRVCLVILFKNFYLKYFFRIN